MQLANAADQCQACCFYRLIELDSGRVRELCALTGEKRPHTGRAGCQFLAGEWSQLDAILNLPKSRLYGNLDFPNHAKPVAAYFHKEENVANIYALDDFSARPINHISEKLKGSLIRPEYREVPVARMARERIRLPFHV